MNFRRGGILALIVLLSGCQTSLNQAGTDTKPSVITETPSIVVQKSGSFTNTFATTPELQEQQRLLREIQALPKSDNDLAVEWIKRNNRHLSPAFLYELSRRALSKNPNQAMEWFVVASIRARYDAARCVDKTARQGVTTLSRIAVNVAKYAQSNRAAFGQAGLSALSRSDLFDSDVSPIWICIHGLKAITAGLNKQKLTEAEWFVPKASWPELKRKIIERQTVYFQGQGKPQVDAIAQSKQTFSVYTFEDNLNFGEFSWLNGNELVISARNKSKDAQKNKDLYLWRPEADKRPFEKISGTQRWCAGQEILMYQTSMKFVKGGRNEFRYRMGRKNALENRELIEKGVYSAIDRHQDWSVGFTRRSSPYRQNSFTCELVKDDELPVIENANWQPLIDDDGFLSFKFARAELRSEEPAVIFARATDLKAKPLAIYWSAVLPKCVKYYDFMDAYFLSPCGLGLKNIAALKVEECIPFWWLKISPSGLQVDEQCAPVDSLVENLPQMVPSKAGLLRLIQSRRTLHGKKIGGVYLTSPNGLSEKILDAWVSDFAMSPNGCHLAVKHRVGSGFRDTRIDVVDVCSGK